MQLPVSCNSLYFAAPFTAATGKENEERAEVVGIEGSGCCWEHPIQPVLLFLQWQLSLTLSQQQESYIIQELSGGGERQFY